MIEMIFFEIPTKHTVGMTEPAIYNLDIVKYDVTYHKHFNRDLASGVISDFNRLNCTSILIDYWICSGFSNLDF